MAALSRSNTDRYLFGVCGGLAEKLEVETKWVRAVFLFFAGGPGILLYLILAITMEEAPALEGADYPPLPPRGS